MIRNGLLSNVKSLNSYTIFKLTVERNNEVYAIDDCHYLHLIDTFRF